jgi:eukaryotic-like serine/threonine-protein kinase
VSAPTSAAAPDRPTGSATATSGPEAPPPVEPRSRADWTRVLDGLYAARADAYGSGSAVALDAVYTIGSPLRAADAAEVADLRSAGAQVRGFAPEVVEVRSAERAGDRVELELVDRWPVYTVVGDDGTAQTVPARGDRLVAMVLVRSGDSWRIDTARLLP